MNNQLKDLKSIRSKFPENVILSYININSIRYKLGNLESLIGGIVDILCIAETKIDDSFPNSQFSLSAYKNPPYRLDISNKSGGLLTFVKKDIPSRRLSISLPNDIQILPVELNLRKSKWLLLSVYKPPKQKVAYFFEKLSECVAFFSTYDSIIVLGDMNLEPDSSEMSNFIQYHSLYNHMKEKTCWKSQEGTCIDLILSNRKHSLQNTGTLETGLSDHHALVYTMLKTTFQKLPAQKINYRKWKDFDVDLFNMELSENLMCVRDDFSTFNNIFIQLLNKHAPMKTKFLRGNNQPHLTKELRKSIMERSKLKNKANRTKNTEDWAAYKVQRNLVVKINRQAKKDFLASSLPNSKIFWKKVKSFLNSKGTTSFERILLVEDGEIVSNDGSIATIFNSFFNSITDNLNIPAIPSLKVLDTPDSVSIAITKYASHPSILRIKSMTDGFSKFEFETISRESIIREIENLNLKKSVSGEVPVKALKFAKFSCADVLTACFNHHVIDLSEFPNELKLADIIPVYKKDSAYDKENYRPISLLPVFAKVFEKIIVKQFNPFIEKWFSKHLCGFRKGHSTQHALLNMLRKWQKHLDTSGKIGAVLMDLSKAFDCLPHDLLIAKLAAYGVGKNALRLFSSYLRNREHRVRIGSTFSEFLRFQIGVPQGSVLGPILFNILSTIFC